MEEFIKFYIPTVISTANNNMLIKCLDDKDIKEVVFSLKSNSVSSPNGFGVLSITQVGIFLILMFRVVCQFSIQNWILSGMNNNVVSLIPKINEADSIKDLRPICCGQLYIQIHL